MLTSFSRGLPSTRVVLCFSRGLPGMRAVLGLSRGLPSTRAVTSFSRGLPGRRAGRRSGAPVLEFMVQSLGLIEGLGFRV
jgi:hypothetical protein